MYTYGKLSVFLPPALSSAACNASAQNAVKACGASCEAIECPKPIFVVFEPVGTHRNRSTAERQIQCARGPWSRLQLYHMLVKQIVTHQRPEYGRNHHDRRLDKRWLVCPKAQLSTGEGFASPGGFRPLARHLTHLQPAGFQRGGLCSHACSGHTPSIAMY